MQSLISEKTPRESANEIFERLIAPRMDQGTESLKVLQGEMQIVYSQPIAVLRELGNRFIREAETLANKRMILRAKERSNDFRMIKP